MMEIENVAQVKFMFVLDRIQALRGLWIYD